MIKRAWTGYAALLTAAVVAGEVANLLQGAAVDFRTVGNWIVTGVLLLGTWGYALQRPVGARDYWRAASWVVLLASLATVVPAALAGRAAQVVVVTLLVLVAPAFYAVFRYAYGSPDVWSATGRSPRGS